jgi:Uma2 family endonuclease
MTPDEYLEIERKAEFRSEYYRGEMFARERARLPHVQLSSHAFGELALQLRDRDCLPVGSKVRLCVKASDFFAYPDLTIVCGEFQFLDDTEDTLLNPTVIIEVLSEATEAYDRGRKFELYRGLDSLKEYVLISSLEVSVECFTRGTGATWTFRATTDLADTVHLRSVDCHLALADLYERVDFSNDQPPLA